MSYYLAGVNIVNAIFKYRGIDWSALRKLSLTVAFALTIITPDTVVPLIFDFVITKVYCNPKGSTVVPQETRTNAYPILISQAIIVPNPDTICR